MATYVCLPMGHFVHACSFDHALGELWSYMSTTHTLHVFSLKGASRVYASVKQLVHSAGDCCSEREGNAGSGTRGVPTQANRLSTAAHSGSCEYLSYAVAQVIPSHTSSMYADVSVNCQVHAQLHYVLYAPVLTPVAVPITS